MAKLLDLDKFHEHENELYRKAFEVITIRMRELVNDKCQSKKGRFPYIPNQRYKFVEQLNIAIKLKPNSKTFLDIGCGIGAMSYLAKRTNLDAYGIDIVKEYVDFANEMNYGKIHHHNILSYNNYGDFDILYMYEPLSSDKLKVRLFNRVVKQMKTGALLIYFEGIPCKRPSCLEQITRVIWEKIEVPDQITA